MTHLRLALLGVFLVGAIAAALGIDVRATYGAQVTADEPQYLLTAISLAEDRSLDISDEIEDLRYQPFHEVLLDRQTEPAADGSEVSPHDPGLPALLALPMDLGGWRAAKGFLAIVGGLVAAASLWVAVRRFDARLRPAAIVVTLFAASAPFAVYGNQVYPEIVAALAVISAIACIGGRLGAWGIAGAVAAIVALPWLSVKYIPVAAALTAVQLVTLWRGGRRTAAIWGIGALVVSGIVFVLAHLEWYGGLTPYATGDHFVDTGEFSVVGTRMNLLGRARRLIGLLIDDTFGLVAWQPLFALVVPALAAFWARRDGRRSLLLVPLGAGWLNATFLALTMQGWWWPGRQLVVVLPCLVVITCMWVTSKQRLLVTLGLGLLGCITYAWLVVEGLQGRLTWVVDFFTTRNPIYRGLDLILPDYLDVTIWTWVLQGLWLVAFALVAVITYRRARIGEGVSALP